MELSFHLCGNSPPPPMTPSDIDKFTCPSPQVKEGQVTSFGCDIASDIVSDLEEEDIPPHLENVNPLYQ